MLRRSIWQLTSGTPHGRIRLQITTQIPSYYSSRRGFSAPSQSSVPEGPGSTAEAEVPKSSRKSKIIFSGMATGAAITLAYRFGYLDRFLMKEPHSTPEPIKVSPNEQDKQDLPGSEILQQGSEPISDSNSSASDVLHSGEDIVAESVPSLSDKIGIKPEESVHGDSEPKSEHIKPIQEEPFPSSPKVTIQSNDTSNLNKPSDADNLDSKKPEAIDLDQPKAVETTPSFHKESRAVLDIEKDSVSTSPPSTPDSHKDDLGDAPHRPASLLGEYHLKNDSEEPPAALADSTIKSEDLHGINEGGYVSGDGKLVLDFLQAIHAAEERQAELDAQAYDKEKRAIKVKYEKELRDARARELMYAEREAILEKELKREKVKAAAALKALEEELEEKHREDLENKVNEAELEFKKVQELAKAQLASAIASEKASQIEKMAEANLNINALCMAFYARSEEARQSHSVHKLALGALSLEDALSKGLPVQKEIEALRTCLEGTDDDSLLDIVLHSLPEETRTSGTDTLLQLNQKFDALKKTIRHFSLIPPGGGGILSHSLAHVASTLKVSEAGQSGDGVESLMNKVDHFLAEGKLIEAADVLEKGVDGTQAAEVVGDWVKQARNRAITEQALTLLQSYATTISLT